MTTPGRRELAAALKQMAERSGLSNAAIARHLGVHEATVGRYLNDRVVATPEQVRQIIAAAGAQGTDLATEALQLAEDLRSGAATRVVILRPGTLTQQKRYAEYEAAAEHISTFTIAVVPGLLQIEPYARSIFVAGGLRGAQLEENLRDRITTRQQMLDDPTRRYTQIMSEGALRWQGAAPDVMAEQMRHIARRARTDTGGRVRIGVVPWHVQVDFFPRTSFDLYDDGRAVIIGTDFGVSFLDRPRDVDVYVRQFRRLTELARFDADAAVELDRIAEDYERLQTS